MQASRPEPAAPSDARSIVVAGQRLWVEVRRGDGTRVPLLLFNGIGASLELLQPFVDALDPSLEVIRFDVPGVGGSPAAGPALPVHRPVPPGEPDAGRDRVRRAGRRARDLLGRGRGPALRRPPARPVPAPGPGRHRHRRRSCLPPRPGVLARMVTPRRYLDQEYLKQVAPALYGGSARAEPAPGQHADARARAGRVTARLPVPAHRRRRLDQPAVPAAAAPAHADHVRGRRPADPAGQRPAAAAR